ncbi:hypothetical protein HELRODRAFT_173462 [Helobdella robusta]|uniref:Uncharacterized protein n=1 Tax=Helobdella robusta TaxID=6412 RepID=T1F6V0_HELRO|nr:hypothetical protein HELRODRAFT_173462 [Helobdella robusta]ESO03761.1 hypothetical protein HELRODRAFT_173462 [Helobdella robusta]
MTSVFQSTKLQSQVNYDFLDEETEDIGRSKFVLALLSSIGFCISFGIRCNMGVAVLQMTRNHTSPNDTTAITIDVCGGREKTLVAKVYQARAAFRRNETKET